MIAAVVNEPFEALLLEAPAGLGAGLTVQVYDPSDAMQILPATSVGITEPQPGTYRTALAVATVGTFLVRWEWGAISAEEALTVTATTAGAMVPSVAEVALLLRSRTQTIPGLDLGGDTGPEQLETFTVTTRPTAAEVQRLIDTAYGTVMGRIIGTVPDEFVAEARHAVALYAAILVELSFFREQADDAAVKVLRELYAAAMATLKQSVRDASPRPAFGSLVIGTTRGGG